MASDLTLEAYIKCLKEVVQPWIEKVTVESSYNWHQHCASSHTSRKIQSWQLGNFSYHITSNIWLLYSPNCNLLDYYIWGNKTLYNTKDKLKARVMAAFKILNKEPVGKACRKIQSHLETLVEANGNFFKET